MSDMDGEKMALLSANREDQPLLLSDADQLFLERQKASVVSTFFNLSQGILGAGSFGIPAALAFTGLSGGLALMVLVAAISALTMWMLAEIMRPLRTNSYQGLLTHTLGTKVSFLSQLFIIFYSYGASVLYLQLLRDNFHSPIRFLAGRDEWYTDPRFIICVFTVFVCGPMCLFRTMHTLSRFSTLGVAVVVLSVLFVATDGIKYLVDPVIVSPGNFTMAFNVTHGPPPIEPGINLSLAFFRGFPVLVFAFTSHVGFVPMFAELKDPTQKRGWTVLGSAFALCFFLYASIGVPAYLRIGSACFESVHAPECLAFFPYLADSPSGLSLSNVLNFYPPGYVFAIITRFGMCVTLCVGFPLQVFTVRLVFASLFFQSRELSTLVHVVSTVVFVALVLTLVVLPVDISAVFNFTGSIGGVAFMIIFPVWMYRQSDPTSRVRLVLAIVLTVFGVASGAIAIAAQFLFP